MSLLKYRQMFYHITASLNMLLECIMQTGLFLPYLFPSKAMAWLRFAHRKLNKYTGMDAVCICEFDNTLCL